MKCKQTDEELYETNENYTNPKNNIQKIIYFTIKMYFKLIVKIKEIFCIITVKEIYTGLILILPFYETEDKQKRIKYKLKRCIPKIKKLMKRYQISTLVLSEKLRENKEFLKEFQEDRILDKKLHILNEKEMMPYLIKEIMEYILQKSGNTTELEDLYLLIKKDYSSYKENIAFLAQSFKTINIVTTSIKNYQKLANQLEEKYNVMITVNNNKKKSLRKAKWIVNFDVPIEDMKKYTICQNSAIIYLEENGIYQEGGFEGIHICNAGIDVSDEIKEYFTDQNLLGQYPITILYESTITGKNSFLAIKKQMKKDKLKVTKLYGSRGVLEDCEYKKLF